MLSMLHILPFLLFFLAIPSSSVSTAVAPTHTNVSPKICNSLRARVEWRMLDSQQKNAYIRAVGCLQHKPARNSTHAVTTRFDELQALHIALSDTIHTVGHFLPWHRQFTVLHETLLRKECQYRGPVPYWDWTKDADELEHMRDSPIFNPENGFGGDGVPGTYTLPQNYSTLAPSRVPINPPAFKGCVRDGPFASRPITLGPGKLITEHCLVRGINNTYKQYLTAEAVHNATKLTDFEAFRIEVEGRPVTPTPKMHDAVHVLVGGDMSNFYSSVADPLFFLHHANIDRIWWKWQQMNPVKRLYEITGRSTMDPPYTNVTLDFKLDFGTHSPSVAIRDVMNIHAEPVCYTYV